MKCCYKVYTVYGKLFIENIIELFLLLSAWKKATEFGPAATPKAAILGKYRRLVHAALVTLGLLCSGLRELPIPFI